MAVYETTVRSMSAGTKIKIQGCTTQCSNVFAINLECKNQCDGLKIVPFHISVRFKEGCIVRNTHNKCGWGHEERDGGMPITRGESFTIELECKPLAFRISVNGSHFSDFKHRLPFDTIKNLLITGDVKICDVRFNETPEPGFDDKDMTILHKTAVPNRFPGRRIKIEGSTTQSIRWFNINLQSKTPSGSSFLIPLHISVRFDEECIIRNTFTEFWGEEEKCGSMPITRGKPFIIEVVCKTEVFDIYINGCLFCDYKYRLPLKTVDILAVHGTADVKICDVIFSGTPQHCNNTMPSDWDSQTPC